MDDELQGREEEASSLLATVGNEFEADIICERLAEGGIIAAVQASGRGNAFAGGRDIYVQEHDLERAREILQDAEEVSDEELTELSERGDADDG